MKTLKPTMQIILTTIFVFTFFFLFSSLFGFYTAIRPPKIISHITPEALDLEYENITFKTKDGLMLSGWFIPNEKESAKTIVLLHGYPADKGDILPAMAFLHKEYNLFLFDFRYLGESEGAYSTMGAKETEDLLAAIRFLKTRDIEEIGVWGFSLGGAVVLMAAPEAPEIKAIVTESSYARLDLLATQLYRFGPIKAPLGFLTNLWGKIILGIDTKAISPANSARTLTIPILVIHSKNDQIIPFSHAEILEEALQHNPQAEFWFEESLVHGQFGSAYEKRIGEFFSTNLTSKK